MAVAQALHYKTQEDPQRGKNGDKKKKKKKKKKRQTCL
jgi:hypothetical protein